MKYPKIKTLWERDAENNYRTVIPGKPARPEFGLVNRWLITEKIDGRNHRVMLFPDGHVEHRGRTDRAQFADFMMEGVEAIIDDDLVRGAIDVDDDGMYPLTVFYGELYGPKIQSGGKYSDSIGFRLFDVRIGDWWMEWEDVKGLANMLGVQTVPILGYTDYLPERKGDLLVHLPGGYSDLGHRMRVSAEGIVARTVPLLFDRRGQRVMWKLKLKDFERS